MLSVQPNCSIPPICCHHLPHNPNPISPISIRYNTRHKKQFLRSIIPKCPAFRIIKAASKSDYYTALNVSKIATLDEIESSYWSLAHKYHPDKTPGSEDKFKEIIAAYEVLSSKEKRKLYDRFGEAGLQGESVGPNFNVQEVRSDVNLTFEESVFGVEVLSLETCGVCDGAGAKSTKKCECAVTERGKKWKKTQSGVFPEVSQCLCARDGKVVTDDCKKCGGLGSIRSKRRFNVVIPPGVDDGVTMQLRGEGNLDRNRGIRGDLYLVLHIKGKHGIWREGLNLFSRVRISYTQAILGTVIEVETVEGIKELHIPSGIQPGDVLKVQCMGVPNSEEHSGRGYHLFIVDIQIPTTISDRERELIEELASLQKSSAEYSMSSEGKSKMERQKYNSNWRGITNNSFTKSLGQLFRGRQSRNGFASSTLEMTSTLSKCGKMNPPISFSSFAAILFCCAFSLVTKTMYRKSIKANSPTQFSATNPVRKH